MRWPISECRRAGDDHDTHNRRRQAENNEDGEIANPEEEMFRSKLAAIVVIGSLAGSLVGSLAWAQGADAPKNLHFAWQQATPTTTFWVGFDLKTFEAQGLKLDLTSFNDNAPELEALVAHQVDLAAVARESVDHVRPLVHITVRSVVGSGTTFTVRLPPATAARIDS